MKRSTADALTFRPMTPKDLEVVPLRCQGARDEILDAMQRIGSCAMLAFDGEQHVAQLQFRPYDPKLRSTNGIWDPRYWGDFGEDAPALPTGAIALFCYHVGQLDDSDARDSRYQGCGIGTQLLDALIAWADERRCPAIIAKCTPAPFAVMAFMGGLPARRYVERGFSLTDSWVDPELRETICERGLIAADVDQDLAATVGCCIRMN